MKIKTIGILLILTIIALSLGTVAAENQTDVLTSDINVNGTDTVSIQNAINKANDGDTVNLGENKEYSINETISINKNINIVANNVSINSVNQNHVVEIRYTDSVSVSGITFNNLNPLPDYGGTIQGLAIYSQANNNLLITDCKFINYSSGTYLSSTDSSTIKNCYFTGTTTAVKAGTEAGTKAINLMGSKGIRIINNTFEGQVLDGVSIASTSGNVLVENNTFINNTYAIFYGGASTEGSKIRNNRFITCGYINTTWYSSYLSQTFQVYYDDLPFISLQKASDNLEIVGNTFTVQDNNIVILSEAENKEHGYPSSIGAINITDNTVLKANENVNAKSVTFYYLKVLESLSLSPIGDIVIKNNNFTDISDIDTFHLEFASIKSGDNSILIPKAKTDTYMTVTYVKDGRVIIALFDINDKEIIGEKITYRVNGGDEITDETDMYGHIYINGLSGENKIAAKFQGSDRYIKSNLQTTIQASPTQTATGISAGALTVNAISAKGSAYKFTLKDATGKVLASKSVSISFDGKIYTATSDGNGIVSFKLPTNTAGKYAITMAFTGDSTYKGSVATSTISIVKQVTKLTVAKKTFKKSATKKVTAVLKDNAGKVLSSKKMTLKVNGKTYTAKTNSKGVATFKVKLTKKGTFKATTKFAGDAYYTAKTTSSKIVVK